MSLTYGSVCSGIEAASVAWHPLGWRAAFVSEIEAFPRAVLKHRWPEIPLHGDFTTIQAGEYEPIDLLVGGTPCQSFSVAGLRGGLADDRGNLALEYLRLADRLRPRWLVWENVPGVLSSLSHAAPNPCPPPPPMDLGCNGAEMVTEDEYSSEELHAFNSFLAGVRELGYGLAYRVLDAQYFGVPQRRRRVFVVGYLGDWRRAAAVLFERYSLQGHSPPRREAGEGAAGRVAPSLDASFGHLQGCSGQDANHGHGHLIAHSLRGDGFDASEDGPGRGTPLVAVTPLDMRQASRGATMTNNRAEGSSGGAPGTGIGEPGDPSPTIASSHVPAICFSSKDHGADAETDLAPTLRAGGHSGSHANAGVPPAIAFNLRGREGGAMPEADDLASMRAASGGSSRSYLAFNARQDPTHGPVADPLGTKDTGHGLLTGSAVRRLTPRECERLQGFPDDYTLIPWRKGAAPDGPRYKALGNSMAVPVMRWIGERIAATETIELRTAA